MADNINQVGEPNLAPGAVSEVHAQAAKDSIKDADKQKEKFDQLVQSGSTVLYKIKSVFPFDLFPNVLSVDAEKITVKFNEFFSSSEIKSIFIKDITQIYVDSGPLFATMSITDQFMMVGSNTKIVLPYLKKMEAMKARRIIQGLVIAHKQNINVVKLEDAHLVEKLEELGKMQ